MPINLRVPEEFARATLPFQGGTYRCVITRVIDGDTLDLFIDIGFNLYFYLPTRISGMNAPELSTPEGKLARTHAYNIAAGMEGIAHTAKDTDKYGRYLAAVTIYPYNANPYDFATRMIADGFAVVWDGTGQKP